MPKIHSCSFRWSEEDHKLARTQLLELTTTEDILWISCFSITLCTPFNIVTAIEKDSTEQRLYRDEVESYDFKKRFCLIAALAPHLYPEKGPLFHYSSILLYLLNIEIDEHCHQLSILAIYQLIVGPRIRSIQVAVIPLYPIFPFLIVANICIFVSCNLRVMTGKRGKWVLPGIPWESYPPS